MIVQNRMKHKPFFPQKHKTCLTFTLKSSPGCVYRLRDNEYSFSTNTGGLSLTSSTSTSTSTWLLRDSGLLLSAATTVSMWRLTVSRSRDTEVCISPDVWFIWKLKHKTSDSLSSVDGCNTTYQHVEEYNT